jgi:hypothetical protein
MFVDLVETLYKKRVRTGDSIRRDENDAKFKALVEAGVQWAKVEQGFKVRPRSPCVCMYMHVPYATPCALLLLCPIDPLPRPHGREGLQALRPQGGG